MILINEFRLKVSIRRNRNHICDNLKSPFQIYFFQESTFFETVQKAMDMDMENVEWIYEGK